MPEAHAFVCLAKEERMGAWVPVRRTECLVIYVFLTFHDVLDDAGTLFEVLHW